MLLLDLENRVLQQSLWECGRDCKAGAGQPRATRRERRFHTAREQSAEQAAKGGHVSCRWHLQLTSDSCGTQTRLSRRLSSTNTSLSRIRWQAARERPQRWPQSLPRPAASPNGRPSPSRAGGASGRGSKARRERYCLPEAQELR